MGGGQTEEKRDTILFRLSIEAGVTNEQAECKSVGLRKETDGIHGGTGNEPICLMYYFDAALLKSDR